MNSGFIPLSDWTAVIPMDSYMFYCVLTIKWHGLRKQHEKLIGRNRGSKGQNGQSSCMKHFHAENFYSTTLYLVDMHKGISVLYITLSDFYGDSMNKFQDKI